jgi:endonuclease YncB( thermonuclease family)
MPLLLSLLLMSVPVSESYPAELVSCYDGDTCDLNLILRTQTSTAGMGVVTRTQTLLLSQKVRLCDIQAPEIWPLITREAAKVSRDALVRWARAAKKLVVEMPTKPCSRGRCPRTGKYGRLLVWLYADGVSLNQRLLNEGLAHVPSPS